MAHAYTPGLRVAQYAVLRRERKLPLAGEVHVRPGDTVSAEQVVASTELPGQVTIVNAAQRLGCTPEEVPELMLKQEGDAVEAGELLAESKGLWGLFRSTCEAPITGTVESISDVTGQVALRGPALPVELRAYLDGTVVEVLPEEGVIVEAQVSLLQGIFGIGGETYGVLELRADGPEEELTARQVDEACAGKVIAGGSCVTLDALRAAVEVGAAGVVAGGIDYNDLEAFLGYPLGVAITGHEDVGLSLVITEGFGRVPMAQGTFDLLKSLAGRRTSMNGQTQIRAGVIRPEVIVARSGPAPEEAVRAAEIGLEEGSRVRLIREPYFGRLAQVAELPEALTEIETEARVRVLIARLDNGDLVTVPRANVELVEE